MSPAADPASVLLLGATGYVGGRLLRALEAEGMRVRCLARRPEFLRPRVGPHTEVVAGDVLDPVSLPAAFAGVATAYYLVHSMGAGASFERRDRDGALNVAAAAAAAGCRRIVYLGGLGREDEPLSPHLRSRQEVGRILRESPVETIEFRASVILGSGSLSFELIRALVERLPVMVIPRWVSTPAQPIGIEDVIAYLRAALDRPPGPSRIYEIGGADVVSYLDMMLEYARRRGLRRYLIKVPVLTPRLSALWLGLVTPVFARIGRELIEGVRNPTRVHDPAALADFAIRPLGIRAAVDRVLRHEDRETAETRWSDALSSAGQSRSWAGVRFGHRIVDSRTVHVPGPPARAFAPLRRIGGNTGWYFGDWLWRLRGALDLVAGGVGFRRGRRDPDRLLPGDVVDFWRVEAIEPDRRLRLFAEMKLPGRAWLQFEVDESAAGCTLRQTAEFDPAGLFGILYWYGLYPLHQLVFSGMLRAMAAAARREPWPPARAAHTAPLGMPIARSAP
ncbi:MAG: NAD(P)-dependent oxidoreductase [Candidatus Eisenbacteria bacterium RBG_16_71_46]|nr:MAG: NAD(P)-dependent oxidoreductase [Candidatus Eisenbacteria bacterium RBG_16_71_46]